MTKALDLFDFATGEATDLTVGERAMAAKKVAIAPSVRKRKRPRITSVKHNINNDYTADDIEVLEGLEPVRRRPAMFVGGTDSHAVHHLLAEVLDNSMDEAIAGHATWIELSLHADGKTRIPSSRTSPRSKSS